MKAIMYHYVRPFDPEYPNFSNLDIDDFKKQLDFFESEYGFVNQEDFLSSFESKELPRGIILTFDDGLSCHHQHVFHELKRRKLWGIFYIPVFPYLKNKILDVHRTHLLLGRYKPNDVYSYLQKIVTDGMIDNSNIEEFKKFTYSSQKNDEYALLVKRMTNYFIDYKYRTSVMNDLMTNFFPNEHDIFSKFYLSPNQIKEMHEENMIIGSHTINHPVMARLTEQEQNIEIQDSFKFLESITGKLSHRTFCYPYGGYHSFTETTEKLLIQNNCKYSFNVEFRDIEIKDIINRPQALPRYDCNQFKFGQVRHKYS